MMGAEVIPAEYIKILLVDDDEVDRQAIKRALNNNKLNSTIDEAVTVDEAVELMDKQDFDLVLLDYKMPQRDGIELLHELKKHQRRQKNAIIMMSTSDDEEIIMQCLQAGAQDFISKSALSDASLKCSILNAQFRFSLEKQLKDSFNKVKHLAEIDHLTGLYNRYAFDKYLKEKALEVSQTSESMTLILVDIDHFKIINDSYGHDAGDQLLAKFANRMERVIKPNIFFSRVGGDEFGIVISGADSEADAERLCVDMVAALAKPLEFDGRIEAISLSMGMATMPGTSNSAIALFKHADMAVYEAKSSGRNQYKIFELGMQQAVMKKADTEKSLRNAIEANQFELYYQPIFSQGKTESLEGFEALLRWQRDTLVGPEEFILVAEETKLIKVIGRWVIQQAIEQLIQWNAMGKNRLKMSINLSAVQLEDPQLVEWIKDCVGQHDIDFSQLEFELTETALLESNATTVSMLKAIVDLGCSLALDDFGTGFSSFTHLKNFPINTVKIDKSLLPDESEDIGAYRLFKGMCGMIQSLDLKITVEGIENPGQLGLSQSMQVNYMQGFLLGKPASLRATEQRFFIKK